jgi:hypothetical protein
MARRCQRSQASTNPKEKKAWTFVGPARPVLKIVYLPWRDGSGRLHPRTTGFVPVDAPHASEASSAPLDAKAMGAGTDMSLLTLAEMAPDMALMDPSPKPAMPAKPKVDAAPPPRSGRGDQGQGEGDPEPAPRTASTPKPSASQPTQAKTSAATFPPQGN